MKAKALELLHRFCKAIGLREALANACGIAICIAILWVLFVGGG